MSLTRAHESCNHRRVGAFSSAFIARLDRVPIRGTFEAHLTVDTDRRAEFEALCAELGVAHVGIELPDGAHRAQPMTASYHRGELADVVVEIEALYAKLVARDFTVVRVKLEALASNDGVPVADEPGDGYFEFHVKMRVPEGEIPRLASIAAQHDARLSRNDRRRDADGVQRFVTLRCYHVGRASAEAKLDALVAALAGFTVAGTAREYTVYDSRIELDAGWLEPPA
jgi:hypothetical protein